MTDNASHTMTKQPTSSSKCPKCHGTGMYIFSQKASEYAKERGLDHIYGQRDPEIWVGKPCPYCKGGFTNSVKVAKKLAEIPSTFYDKSLKDFDWNIYVADNGVVADTKSQQEGIRSFIDKFDVWEKRNTGLYIWSKTKGSGKTFLASCICNELMSQRAIRTRFISASELLDRASSADKTSYDADRRDPLKLLRECKFLVIDDLGQKNMGNEWLEDILFKLLDERMTNSRMTIITSNLAIQELPFNERITDRINKLCMPFHLPEICVRSKEIRESRLELLKELDLNKKEV